MTNRANAICLLKILSEYSDDSHIMQMQDIISKFKILYRTDIDRRTVYGLMDILAQLGYDISDYNENGIGYYLRERYFESSEIRLMMDAIYTHQAISPKQTEKLIQKLQKLLNIHNRKKYTSLSVVKNSKKTENQQVFLNIEILDEAIQEKKKVSFVYLIYGLDKKLHPRKEYKYTVNPYQLLCTNEHYYLICKMSGAEKLSMYRIDLMKEIDISDDNVDTELSSEEKQTVENKTTYAWYGNAEKIEVKCKNYVIGDILDKFGHDITITPLDEEHFIATIHTAPAGMHFWALQYLPHVEVLSPDWVRDGIIDSVKRNPYLEVKE